LEKYFGIFFRENRKVGGAPFNVAYHLSRMGLDVSMISSVGDDQLGRDLLHKMKRWNIPSDHVQINTQYPTSTVIATVDENNEAHYDIVEGVAWDFIEATKKIRKFSIRQMLWYLEHSQQGTRNPEIHYFSCLKKVIIMFLTSISESLITKWE
jgi:sugar/nucleoside kinase (ribokinase family)